jgi:hypothetical protein
MHVFKLRGHRMRFLLLDTARGIFCSIIAVFWFIIELLDTRYVNPFTRRLDMSRFSLKDKITALSLFRKKLATSSLNFLKPTGYVMHQQV